MNTLCLIEDQVRPRRKRRTIKALMALVSASLVLGAHAAAPKAELPNILWITCEDAGPQLGCYGDQYADTPHIDRFAEKSLRYLYAWSNAPVCAPARTTIITGVYPTSLGAEHMRSEVRIPAFMSLYPQLLRERGYYCTNNSKEDYNVVQVGRVWDESSRKAHWRNRAPGQPFFAIFNYTVSHESQIRVRPHTPVHDAAEAPVPAYHPDTPEVRRDWAQYYDKVTEMDAQAGLRLEELEQAGLADDTIVFFYGDHGSGMPRGKRWPYNSGLHVPFIVHVPEKWQALAPEDYEAGGTSERLVGFVDLAPTLLSLAGAKPPVWMQGHAFMGKHATPPPKYLHGFRGRMDERYDMVRSVRNERYVYLRHYMPHLIYGQHVGYMFVTPTTRVWRQLYKEGKLEPPQTFFWERKPPEELYDLQADPDEVNNLADSPEHRAVLLDLRAAHLRHALEIRDLGFLSEAEMHARKGEATLYEIGHDDSRYPLRRIMRAAGQAASLEPEDLPRLRKALAADDSGIRYWGAMGILMRGADAVASSREDLLKALQDNSPSVRLMAAWALGEFGSVADLGLALETIRELAPPDENGPYVSMLACNVIDALGGKASSLHGLLREMPSKDPQAPARPNGYVARLQKSILEGKTGW